MIWSKGTHAEKELVGSEKTVPRHHSCVPCIRGWQPRGGACTAASPKIRDTVMGAAQQSRKHDRTFTSGGGRRRASSSATSPQMPSWATANPNTAPTTASGRLARAAVTEACSLSIESATAVGAILHTCPRATQREHVASARKRKAECAMVASAPASPPPTHPMTHLCSRTRENATFPLH